MQVYPDKLKSFVEKATFNKTYCDINFLVTPEKVMSLRMSPDRNFAYQIEYPNFFEGFSEPFDLKMELASGANKTKKSISIALNLFNFKCEKVDARIEEKVTNGEKLAFLHLKNEKAKNEILLLEPDPPLDFVFPDPTEPSVTIKFDDFADVCYAARKSCGSQIRFEITDGKLYMISEFDEKLATNSKGRDKTIRMIADAPKSWREAKYLFWNFNDIKNLYAVIRTNPKHYIIKICNDRNNGFIFLHVESKDRKERYIFYLLEASELENEFEFKPPEIPEKWIYGESIKKVKPEILKWKNLSEEIVKELYIAREVLSMSPSDAAKIMHGTFVPRMTWGEYCAEIGYSRRTVNRWLKRYYGDEEDEQQEKRGFEVKQKSKPKLPKKYIESIKAVMDSEITNTKDVGYKFDGGKIFLDLQNNAGESGYLTDNLKKLPVTAENRNPNYNEAIVLLNNKDTVYDWFKPCFDGVICFIDHKIKFKENGNNSQGSCFVYFGENEESFIKEFSKYGTLVRKIEVPDNIKVDKYNPESSEQEISDEELLKELESL